MIIGSIHSNQYQNVGRNNNTHLTSQETPAFSMRRGAHSNTVGFYGCLLTTVVNVINSSIAEKHLGLYASDTTHHDKIGDNLYSVADIAKDDDLFEVITRNIETTEAEAALDFDFTGNEDLGSVNVISENKDIMMNSSLVDKALERYTGSNWSVSENIFGEGRIK